MDEHRFQAEVIESDVPVLVDFTADWCAPCRVMKPVLEELAEERDDIRVVSLEIDDAQATAARYDVLAAPTFVLFRSGEPVVRLVGARPKRALAAAIAGAL